MQRAAVLALLMVVTLGVIFWLTFSDSSTPPVAPAPAAEPRPHGTVRYSNEPVGRPPAEPPAAAPRPENPAPSEPPTEPPAPAAESPFLDPNSREIQYAFELLYREGAGRPEWSNAVEVFERCVKAVPSNELCFHGMVSAQKRLNGEEIGPRPTFPLPTPPPAPRQEFAPGPVPTVLQRPATRVPVEVTAPRPNMLIPKK